MRLAFVLLGEVRLPPAADVVAAFGRIAPGGGVLRDGASGDADNLTLELEGVGTVAIALMPAPIPDGEAESAAAYSLASFGRQVPPPVHVAHAVVVLQGADALPVLAQVQALVQVTAALARAAGAVGVYWGDGHVTHPADFFIDVAAEEQVSPMAFSGVSLARHGERLSLLSLGLRQLGLPELMLDAPVKLGNDALFRFLDLLAYVARRGEAIADGDTVGRDANERAVVRHVDSPIEPGAQVMLVELEPPGAS